MLKERNIWKGLALICVVGASGFFLGVWTESPPLERGDSPVTRRAPEWRKEQVLDLSSQIRHISFSGNRDSKVSLVLSRLMAGEIPASWEEELQSILQDDLSSGQLSAIRILFCKWAETDFQAALDRACMLGSLASQIKEELFVQLAVKDSEKALFYYEHNKETLRRERQEILNEIARNWARQDSRSAWEWICSAEFLFYDKYAVVNNFIQGTGFDLEYINRLSGEGAEKMTINLMEKWTMVNQEAAWEWAKSQEETRLQASVLATIAKKDLGKATELLCTAPEQMKPLFIGEVARVIEDKNEALDWISEHVSPEKISGLELGFIWDWVMKNSQEAESWIRGISDPKIKDKAINVFCEMGHSPDKYENVVSLIGEISEVQMRDRVLKDLFAYWQRENNKKKFDAWIQSNPDSSVTRLAKEKGYIK